MSCYFVQTFASFIKCKFIKTPTDPLLHDRGLLWINLWIVLLWCHTNSYCDIISGDSWQNVFKESHVCHVRFLAVVAAFWPSSVSGDCYVIRQLSYHECRVYFGNCMSKHYTKYSFKWWIIHPTHPLCHILLHNECLWKHKVRVVIRFPTGSDDACINSWTGPSTVQIMTIVGV